MLFNFKELFLAILVVLTPLNYCLSEDIEAIEKCKSDSDTYIKDINGKHIVSWKWGNVWYVGVSNHHGEVLASMLPTSK